MESRVLENGTGVYKRAWLSCRATCWRSSDRGTDIRYKDTLSRVLLSRFFFSHIDISSSRAASSKREKTSHPRLMLDALISLKPASIIFTLVLAYRCSKFNGAVISPSVGRKLPQKISRDWVSFTSDRWNTSWWQYTGTLLGYPPYNHTWNFARARVYMCVRTWNSIVHF